MGTAGGSSTAFARPIPLTVGNASNVLVEDLTEIGSPFWVGFTFPSAGLSLTLTTEQLCLPVHQCDVPQDEHFFGIQFVQSRRELWYYSFLSNSRTVLICTLDGWDIYRSSYVTIENSTIHNDDDCAAFKPNTTDALVQNLYCNGSHGISVGSLGQVSFVSEGLVSPR